MPILPCGTKLRIPKCFHEDAKPQWKHSGDDYVTLEAKLTGARGTARVQYCDYLGGPMSNLNFDSLASGSLSHGWLEFGQPNACRILLNHWSP